MTKLLNCRCNPVCVCKPAAPQQGEQKLVEALKLAAKRIHMGAYSLAPLLDADILQTIEDALKSYQEGK